MLFTAKACKLKELSETPKREVITRLGPIQKEPLTSHPPRTSEQLPLAETLDRERDTLNSSTDEGEVAGQTILSDAKPSNNTKSDRNQLNPRN